MKNALACLGVITVLALIVGGVTSLLTLYAIMHEAQQKGYRGMCIETGKYGWADECTFVTAQSPGTPPEAGRNPPSSAE